MLMSEENEVIDVGRERRRSDLREDALDERRSPEAVLVKVCKFGEGGGRVISPEFKYS